MLIKVPYKDRHYRYALSDEKQNVMPKNHTAMLFQQAVTKIDSSMNLVVYTRFPVPHRQLHLLSIMPILMWL